MLEGIGAEDGVRTRDLNLGKVALYQLSHFRSCADQVVGAESQIRTGDTAIFSRVLYQLSYLGPDSGSHRSPSAAQNTTGLATPATTPVGRPGPGQFLNTTGAGTKGTGALPITGVTCQQG